VGEVALNKKYLIRFNRLERVRLKKLIAFCYLHERLRLTIHQKVAMGFIFIFLVFILPFLVVCFNFCYFLYDQKVFTDKFVFKIFQAWSIVVLPFFFLLVTDSGLENDCCIDNVLFSPEHRPTIYTLLIIYTLSYLISIFRTSILTPLAELFINLFLILGIILNIALCIHINGDGQEFILWLAGNVPIILLLLMELSKNHLLLKNQIEEDNLSLNTWAGNLSMSILNLEPILKFPLLTIILIPILILFSIFMMLFGQKPDSIIRAFTDTYKHGFSQLDYMCDNVQCGGHFLCSVGANGHKSIVKPVRYGERNGSKIICNRQLLVSNAFEDLVQENLPKTHKAIRRVYNKVGNQVHKHYHIFNNKLVSDSVYILMKPLEMFFLFVLYLFDKKPENRIAVQYLNKKDRQLINEQMNPSEKD